MPAVAIVAVAFLAGCKDDAAPAPEIRPVRTTMVARRSIAEPIVLTGQIRAQNEVSLAFRIDGRLIERLVNVGDQVSSGQVVAVLDTQIQQNAVRSTQANLVAAQGVLVQTRNEFERQRALLAKGFATRARFDQAQQALQTAQAQLDASQAQLRTTQEQLSYTRLEADAAGVVTAKGAEPGEVVRAGQMILQVARQGGLDAVFDVPAQIIRTGPRDPVVQIWLADDVSVTTTGRVREVAPSADSAARTFQVKVELTHPPEAMLLGATVVGRVDINAAPAIDVPATSLTEAHGKPAVWVVNSADQTVALRNVDVLRYDPSDVIVLHGLETGDIVVTAGVQALRPGQRVRLLGDAS
jgi:RND family efflux transporter MFP subunit